MSLENGKILAESLGEIQEAIDICEFAVGLSRCLNGQVIPSERSEHMMMECWHPLNGHLGIITVSILSCFFFVHIKISALFPKKRCAHLQNSPKYVVFFYNFSETDEKNFIFEHFFKTIYAFFDHF